MKKEIFTRLIKDAKNLKQQATDLGKGAIKTTGAIKEVVEKGISTSKTIVDKATKAVKKENVSQGLDVASKGAGIAAKGAQIASKGADALANTLEKASTGIKSLGDKLKK